MNINQNQSPNSYQLIYKMTKPVLARISKTNDLFKVIYIKNRSFVAKHFNSLMDAIQYAENSLHASHDQVILSINL